MAHEQLGCSRHAAPGCAAAVPDLEQVQHMLLGGPDKPLTPQAVRVFIQHSDYGRQAGVCAAALHLKDARVGPRHCCRHGCTSSRHVAPSQRTSAALLRGDSGRRPRMPLPRSRDRGPTPNRPPLTLTCQPPAGRGTAGHNGGGWAVAVVRAKGAHPRGSAGPNG